MFGGALGAVSRYGVSVVVNSFYTGSFPWGTFCVNGAGSFLIGFLFSVFDALAVPAQMRLFAITGFLGGFTTFSSYSLETMNLLLGGNIKSALLNVLANNGACLVFVFLGIMSGKELL
jgi:CrcB protein